MTRLSTTNKYSHLYLLESQCTTLSICKEATITACIFLNPFTRLYILFPQSEVIRSY